MGLKNNFELDRQGLRDACRFYGGIKSVAMMANVNNSNLGGWLKGKRNTLSTENVASVLMSLGLPHGTPDCSRVHEWRLGAQWPNFSKAIKLYFPKGGRVVHAPWSVFGFKSAIRSLSFAQLGVGGGYQEVYALTDGEMRAVIRRPPSCVFPSIKEFGSKFSWSGGDIDAAEIDVGAHPETWLRGPVEKDVFDSAFSKKEYDWESAIEMARDRGLSVTQFIEWVKSKS